MTKVPTPDLQQFLASVATPMRPFESALRAIDSPFAPSPWTPKPSRSIVQPAVVIDVETIRAEAATSGRAEGLRETAALRDQLATLVRELEVARSAITAPTATQIADAAIAVVTAWAGTAAKSALFGPIVQAWCDAGQVSGVAHVHPTDVGELAAAIGELPISVTPDPTIARGDLAIRNAGFELAHRWESRLPELRDAIALALEAAPKVSP